MTMTKRKGQTTDIKAPQKRSLRSRKREAAEEDDPLTEQREQIPVTETSTQDSDKINSTSQNASVSELTLQEHTGSSDSIGNIDSSKPELKETGDTITQCGGGAHLVSTKGSQSTHSTDSAEPPSNQTKTSHQTSSLCAPEPSLDGEAVLGGHAPTVGGEVVSESRHHHSQEHGGEATDVPGEERPWSSQGADGGHPTHAPARKKVRRRMGMGRLVEREKKNPLDGQNSGGRAIRRSIGGEL
ncbi:uncharacterized protein LOC116219078 [Clupea harengus]|uniref:Uncharacterized protein LOC116219078 n=1 Tax=Clupea harengus TaxID=7950 RepID=A0A6P8ENV0_CLUHA|nr:uncharacterized protein LOC116219078 [Clupea harengus]